MEQDEGGSDAALLFFLRTALDTGCDHK